MDKLSTQSLTFRALMKLSVTQLLMTLLFISTTYAIDVNAQEVLEQRISVKAETTTLKAALISLERLTQVRFVYNPKDVLPTRRVKLENRLATFKTVLDELLLPLHIRYEVSGKQIVLLKAEESSQIPLPDRRNERVISADQPITGTVTDEKGVGLPGVSIVLKNSTKGTTTDPAGKYRIDVPDNEAILVFSFLGYVSQEVTVGSRSVIDIALVTDSKSLNEVVVTALGFNRDKAALSYAVTEIGGENLIKARETNLGNALAGRIAGVNATGLATGPGGSSRVVIRGNGSLNGNNQPLYVVNGVPINNNNQGAPGTFGGIDRGDGLTSINPDDIATITVLKGGTAAALYGARAANGVILITTKSGTAQKGIGVEYNTTLTVETPRDLLDWQYEYGSGSRGKAPVSQAEAIAFGRMSWGAKLDGSPVIQPDGQTRPYVAQKNNIRNFYDNGTTFSNTLAFTGGNETVRFRFSAANLDNKGIVPNNTLNRKTFNLSANANLAKKLLFEGYVQYTLEENKNRVYLADFQKNPNAGAQLIGTNIDVRTLAPGYTPNGTEVIWSDYIYATNPYFAVNKVQNGDTRRRFIGSFNARYNITDWLYSRVRLGMDQLNFDGFNIEPSGIAFNSQGSMTTDLSVATETNAEALIGVTKSVGKLNVNALVGGNQMHNKVDGRTLSSGLFNVPFQYFIGNGSGQAFTVNFQEFAINSLFASADIDYNNTLFLTLTGRQDWFSTLSKENNNLFYPSAGLSYVLTNHWESHPVWLDYAKIRTSWAQVGGGAPNPYGLNLTYTPQAQQHLGATLMNITGNIIPNKLVPYTSTTSEIGVDLKAFRNRVGLDLTLYERSTTNDIVFASVPLSSGYARTALNVGQVRNRGVELLLTSTLISKPKWSWDVSYNAAYNDNKVVKIADGITSLFIDGATTRTQNGGIYHFEGRPFGMIAGNRARVDPTGRTVYNSANGIPVQGPLEPLGLGVPPWVMGISNNFNYGNFSLNLLIDGKFGAQVYSATNAYGTQFGLDKRTVANGVRETGIPVSGVTQTGTEYSANVPAQTYYSAIWATLTDQFVTSADFVKLRSLTLSYNVPKRLLAKTPIQSASLSVVGRNLALLYNAAQNIDPESSYSNGNGQGLENFGLPSTRSFGLNLLVRF
ncbi:TonB-dependent receptor plug [Fibrisoma limi BUZ 3]|uniref:TonB-dependent receptor plug n=1 Tax=Fibrisoma limi BUZ 3 TaxID=1185876 RepID=I2GBG1_9BACT|nr:SusC/RagA family TonB-linked outer membrane protein [Fibrisoma limi]CCH51235.1 TonB-dependent receptor plug [Fibrisoma limi BUZ 3]